MKVETRKVLTMGGLETKDAFTHSLETTSAVALWNDKLICWFQKRTAIKLNQIRGKVLSCKRTFVVQKDGKTAVYSLEGEEIIPFDNYDYITEHCLAIEVCKNSNVGAYSYDGEEIVPLKYRRLSFDKYGISSKISIIKYGLYSYKGEVIVPDNFVLFDIGKAILCRDDDDHYGVYSFDGKILIPVEYDSIGLYENCILVEKDSKIGMLSYFGGVLLPIMFHNISEVSYDNHNYFIAERENGGCCGLYKYNGKEILPAIYDAMRYEDKDYLLVIKSRRYGLYTVDGMELLNPIYKSITNIGDNIFEVENDMGKFYYIASLNRKIYADLVKCIDNKYLSFNNGVWSLIEI